jgi:hypothetical protein
MTTGWHASVTPWFKQGGTRRRRRQRPPAVDDRRQRASDSPAAIVAMGLPLVDVMDLEAVAQVASRLK